MVTRERNEIHIFENRGFFRLEVPIIALLEGRPSGEKSPTRHPGFPAETPASPLLYAGVQHGAGTIHRLCLTPVESRSFLT